MKLIASHADQNSASSDFYQQDSATVLPLSNDADPLAANLEGVDRVELSFPKFTDGRAFSQAWLLRQRRKFQGDIRAVGEVLVDQLLQMQRCGFSSAQLRPGQDMQLALQELGRYQSFYQADLASN